MTPGWSPALLILALAVHGAPPAPASAVEAASAGAAGARRAHRGKGNELQARVASLTRALGLDAGQQAALRTVLLDQRQRVQRIWSTETVSAADRIAAIRKESTQTADRIRSLLSEEQRKRYDPPSRADPGGALGGAHVEEWMKAERSREAP